MPVEVLSRLTHQTLRLRPTIGSYEFARSNLVISLLAAELGSAVHTFPIGFTLMGGKANIVGLVGLNDDGNLFIDQHGRWLGVYTPAALRMRPFSLQSNGTNSDQVVVIDTDSDRINKVDGQPLFEEGHPSKALANIVEFLQACARNQTETDRALAAIIGADILTPWSVPIVLPDGKPLAITGLFQLDSEKLDALSDETFAFLRHEGALPLIYAHGFSLNNIANLERLAREKGPKVVSSPVDFAVLTDDYLKF